MKRYLYSDKTKFIILVSVSINIILLIVTVWLYSVLYGSLTSPKKTPDITTSSYYLDRTSLFDSLPYKSHAVVFIGDSITDNNELAELLQEPNIINRGIAGDTTIGLLNRINQITNLKPDKIFIMIGINDLDQGVDVFNISENYKLILYKILEESPDSKIYIQSVLPVVNQKGNVKVIELNRMLKNLAEENNLTYIDIYQSLSNEYGLDQKYTHDGVHLNGNGYVAWKSILDKYLKE